MGPGPDGVEIRSRNLFMEGTEKTWKKAAGAGGRNAGGQEKVQLRNVKR